MYFIEGFLSGILLHEISIAILFVICLLSVSNDNGIFSTIFGGLLFYAVYKMFIPKDINLLYVIASYLVLGFIWSFWRYKKFVQKEVEDFNEFLKKNPPKYVSPQTNIDWLKQKVSITKNLDNLTFWVVFFPFSMITTLSGDLIDIIKSIISKTFAGVYNSIANSELNKIRIPLESEFTKEEK